MPRWEYRIAFLRAVSSWSTNKGWWVTKINEQEQRDWKNAEVYASVAEFCNHMGQQDWELVGVAYSGPSSLEIELYFRHLLQ